MYMHHFYIVYIHFSVLPVNRSFARLTNSVFPTKKPYKKYRKNIQNGKPDLLNGGQCLKLVHQSKVTVNSLDNDKVLVIIPKLGQQQVMTR